jgi:GrpB-like predicted nucleotidyltransferase (UPF0157 family)
MSRIIEVVPYDPVWPELFKQESALLQEIFGTNIVSINHTGSTSVPGMMAKPTIDILIELKDISNIQSYYEKMKSIGYDCRGECLDAVVPGTPGRFYFSKAIQEKHLYHVHACQSGHYQIREILAFRDYLRNNKEEAEKYGILKYELSKAYKNDNIGYMRGKDKFVKKLIEKALA